MGLYSPSPSHSATLPRKPLEMVDLGRATFASFLFLLNVPCFLNARPLLWCYMTSPRCSVRSFSFLLPCARAHYELFPTIGRFIIPILTRSPPALTVQFPPPSLWALQYVFPDPGIFFSPEWMACPSPLLSDISPKKCKHLFSERPLECRPGFASAERT